MERALILAEDGPLISTEHLLLNDGSARGARSAVTPAVVDDLPLPRAAMLNPWTRNKNVL